MKTTKYLNYLHTCIEVTIDSRAPAAIHDVIDFFSTYVDVADEPETEPIAVMNFFPYDMYPWETLDAGEHIDNRVMRTSTASEFNLQCQLVRVGDTEHFIASKTRTNIVMDKQENRVDVFLSGSSTIQLIELIRDFVVKNEECHGTLILHASAIRVGDCNIVVAGNKGSGKSTLLMEFLSRGGCRLISGDKCFITVEGGKLRIKGWPDYPHLGAGTISRYRTLRSLVEEQYHLDARNMRPEDKLLINPKLFSDKLAIEYEKGDYPLDKCIFPRFVPMSAGSELIPYQKGGIGRLLDNLMFSTDYYQTKWHDFIIPDYSITDGNIEEMKKLLGDVSFWEFSGDLKIDSSFIEEVSR